MGCVPTYAREWYRDYYLTDKTDGPAWLDSVFDAGGWAKFPRPGGWRDPDSLFWRRGEPQP
ncbi:hypothetical protein CGRA01v4_13012 [Colletotrichum graminicola]|nr:hypothetical protein CGRA01v4_13012 [Colletotrichum graminicola]